MRTAKPILAAAKRLRREMTPPEVLLWVRLRAVSPRFRRQHPLGRYVLDFYCPAARMAVEVDGWGHNMGDQPAQDEQRDLWLQQQGMIVQRIPAADVLTDPDEIADGLVRQAGRAPSVGFAATSPASQGR